MFCRYCGNELPDDAHFCNACGKPVDIEQPKQEPLPEVSHEESLGAEGVHAVSDTRKGPVRRSGSKKVTVIAVVVLAVVAMGVLGLRAVNESSMKQQVPRGIYEESKERVINHYDKTMAYPYGNDLGYTYGCDFTTFEFTKGNTSNIFNVDGEMEVMDKSQEDRPSYRIVVHGTVTTDFFKNDWSADWTLFFQDPIYMESLNKSPHTSSRHEFPLDFVRKS